MARNAGDRRGRRARTRRKLATACSVVALALSVASVAFAQEPPAPAPAPTQVQDLDDRDENRIVVIGDRSVIASLQDIPVEQTYDEDSIDSYAVSTVGELLDEIRSENGDAEPSVLVNGQPVSDLDDIADLPVEAISRIEALPRGAAQRVGGAAGQRAYNVVLRPSVKSATLTGSYETASEGGWSNIRGEALFAYIRGQDRISLTLRGANSGTLFESERDFVPRTERYPYSSIGNIVPAAGAEIDPVLSALAGQPVTILALPEGNANPTLADLLAGANQTNPSNQSFYRSLRGGNRPHDVALAGNKILTPWLSLSFNGRLNWTKSENFSGLPSARLLIPASNTFTPFSRSVYLALNDPARPLRSVSDSKNRSVSSTLNADLGVWRATVVGSYDQRERTYTSEITGSLTGGLGTIDSTTNPFDGSLAALIPLSSRESHSKTASSQIAADAEGPLFSLWAGPLRVRARIGGAWVDFNASDVSGDRSFSRHEYAAEAGITIPLTSLESSFLPMFGDSEFALDIGRIDLGRFGTLKRNSLAFNWQMLAWLRLVASEVRDERAIAPELLAAPETITPNVPYFDPLTGQTVDVTTIYGGAGNLQSEDIRTRTLSVAANPLPKYRLQLNVDYVVNDLRNQIGALPPPSSAVVAAFPDRFRRDASGTLILVDSRSVNFARQRSDHMRFGVRFTVPLSEAVTVPPNREAGTARRRISPLNLQVNASHTVLLNDTTVIREGLPEIDLLKGGAIGIGGGRQRHATDVNLALTKGGTGLRLSARRRGAAQVITGTQADPDLLTFDPLTTVDLKVFADLGQLFPSAKLAKDTRLTLAFDNLANERQRVRDTAGAAPQAYQPVRRDPVGRTIMFELRKVF